MRVLSSLLTIVLILAPGHARGQGTVLVGFVSDSLSGSPVENALVSIRGTDLRAATDAEGVFWLDGVEPGRHVLELSSAGFATRSFGFSLQPDHGAFVDLGSVVLEPIPPKLVTITGIITDLESGLPVAGAPLGLNGEPVGFTANDGKFELRTYRAVFGSQNRLTVRRIGYRGQSYGFWVADTATAIELTLTAEPLAARLPDIVVEGERMVIGGGGRLAGFERRRKVGLGHFVTEDEIKKQNPLNTSDVLRRVPGVWVRSSGLSATVELTGSGRLCGAPTIFWNGVLFMTDDINIVMPESIVAIEVYRSGATLPPEFMLPGSGGSSTCGAIVFWTK